MYFRKVDGLTPRSDSAGGMAHPTDGFDFLRRSMSRSQRSSRGKGRGNHTALGGRGAAGDGIVLAESRVRGIRSVAERLSAARRWGMRGGWNHAGRAGA